MSNLNESLSALMDGETDDLEVRRLLNGVEQEPELSATWRRYHLARTALKGEQMDANVDLSGSIAAALEDEPTYAQEKVSASASRHVLAGLRENSRQMWRSVASMAVAASVTAVVIFGVNSFRGGEEPAATNGVAEANGGVVLPQGPVSSDLVRAHFSPDEASVQESGRSADGANSDEVIRLSAGLTSYISQHRQLQAANDEPVMSAGWVPEGYKSVRRELLPHGEMMMYSNGDEAFSVTIEALGYQHSEPGVVQEDGMVAVGRKQNDHFVTVVGDVPLDVADRIAAHIQVR